MPSSTQDPTKVSVGFTTKAASGIGATAIAAAIVAYATGDHSQQTLGVLTSAAVLVITFVITAVGRIVQAKAQIVAVPRPMEVAQAKRFEREASPRRMAGGGAMSPPTTSAPTEFTQPIFPAPSRAPWGAVVSTPGMSDTVSFPNTGLDAEAQAAHDTAVVARSIDDDAPDVFDGVPEFPVTPPGKVGEDLGDPHTRGEVADADLAAAMPATDTSVTA